MSSTDSRTVDPAQPHHDSHGGHERSDFSWTTVLWLLPISALILSAFTFVSIYWFRGAKDNTILTGQAQSQTPELDLQHAKENEILNGYKWLDKDKGRVRIPIQRAMELYVQENQGAGGREWAPITDVYMRGAAFKQAEAAPKTEAVEAAPAKPVHEAKAAKGEAAGGHKAESRAAKPEAK